MSLCDLTKLFRRKKEQSMENRAIDSRRKEDKEIHDQFDQTHRNLETLIDEITENKKHEQIN